MTEGPFMFVHEVTGTYLETDNYNVFLSQSNDQTMSGMRRRDGDRAAGGPAARPRHLGTRRAALTTGATAADDR